MRCTNLGPGELADRLSILALKIAHGLQADRDVTHFINERNVLLVQLRAGSTDAGLEQLFELAAVNAMLWHAEDDLREYRADFTVNGATLPEALAVVAIAFRIQSLNDRRAELVGTLNKLAGQDLGPEKLT